MKMTILSPGPLSTIVDEGRFGYMRTGFSPGGAMDAYAMKTANLLVGNAPGDGTIEMTMMGISASFSCDTVIALTGADMSPMLDGEPIPMYKNVAAPAGAVLSMGAAVSGMRSYLAVAGGFDLPSVMGSMSTNLKCGLGGFEGRKLRAGDALPLRQSVPFALLGERSTTADNNYPSAIGIRVLLGPQDDYFTDKGLTTFLESTYTVTDKSDRMGIRLDGEAIENKEGVDIISDGIATGSVQIPASGTPIIMMADRQTTGGYAKIATVISADLTKIAQARPGTLIRFTAVSRREAVHLKKEEQKKLWDLQYTTIFSR